MLKYIKRAFMGLGLTIAALAGAPEEVRAYGNDHCREYTRTVYIGNRAQEAYGRACLQPDGSWMIVGEGLGNDIPQNASNVDYVIRDNDRYITPPRVVYYTSPRIVHRSSPSFVWYQGGHYRNGQHVSYNRNRWDRHDHRRYDRHDHHGRDDHRGGGRGHGRGHGRD